MGDADGNVPLLYTKRWLKTTGWRITKPWTPFTDPSLEVLLGYTQEFAGKFTLATIRKGGHGAGFEEHNLASQIIERFLFDLPLNEPYS